MRSCARCGWSNGSGLIKLAHYSHNICASCMPELAAFLGVTQNTCNAAETDNIVSGDWVITALGGLSCCRSHEDRVGKVTKIKADGGMLHVEIPYEDMHTFGASGCKLLPRIGQEIEIGPTGISLPDLYNFHSGCHGNIGTISRIHVRERVVLADLGLIITWPLIDMKRTYIED